MNKYELFAELVKDEEKSKEIFSESLTETQQNLKKIGLDFTEDELLEFAKTVQTKATSGELNEAQLSDVNGGILVSSLVAAGWWALGTYAASSAALIWLKRK